MFLSESKVDREMLNNCPVTNSATAKDEAAGVLNTTKPLSLPY